MTSSPILQLGTFQFTLPDGVPQTLERVSEYRWEQQERILREPAYQFVGVGGEEITLDGMLYPGFTGNQSTMETLRTLAASGEAQMLTDGLGRVLGTWVLTRVREGQSRFAPGGAPRRTDFSLTLVRYGEDNPGLAASPLSVSLDSDLPTFIPGLTGPIEVGAEAFTGDGSAFDMISWSDSGFNFSTLTAAQDAGFSLSQVANIARSVANGDYVGATLDVFGLAGLDIDRSNAWAQVGINAAGLVQSMAQGNGPPSMAVALQALAPVSGPFLDQVAGSIGGASGVRSLLRDSASILSMLDVDPHVTENVRSVVEGI